jgi:hypothetical protein
MIKRVEKWLHDLLKLRNEDEFIIFVLWAVVTATFLFSLTQ